MAPSLDELKESIKHFTEKTHLKNITSISKDERLLGNLIAGYSAELSAGIALYYSTEEPEKTNRETLKLIESDTKPEERMRFSHPICKTYRQHYVQNQKCMSYDKEIVMKYYNGEWNKPTIYRCHLNAWDMAFPIIIDDVLLGVLFAGQMVVRRGMVKWREVLKDIIDNPEYQVCWDPCNPKEEILEISDQLEDIRVSISEEAEDAYKDELIELVESCPDTESSKPGDVVSRFQEFIKFRNMLRDLLEELYYSKVEARAQSLLKQFANELTRNTADFKGWWQVLSDITNGFKKATGIGGFDVYTRKQSVYIQQICNSERVADKDASRIPANACVELDSQKLIPINDDERCEKLREQLGKSEEAYLYKNDLAGPDNQHISTLIIVHGVSIKKGWLGNFITEFCEIVGLRTNVSIIQQRIQKDRTEYKRRVVRVSHTVKTPLQTATNKTLQLRNTLSKLNTPGLSVKANFLSDIDSYIKTIRQNIERARHEMMLLHTRGELSRKPDDIIKLLKELVLELGPLADSRKCGFETTFPNSSLVCNIRKDEVRIALRNLLDNAIKYSFAKHNIKIKAYNTAAQRTMIQIANLGMGIPDEKMEAIKQMGERGGIIDKERPKAKRDGTGLGLPIAIEIIHEHGGTLNIDSYAADSGWREPYHRYVTRVDVTLPTYIE